MGPDTLDTDPRSSPSSHSLGDMLQCCSLQAVSLHARWYHCIRFPYCSTRTDHDQMRISLWVWRLQWTAARNSADWGGLPSLRFSPDLAETRLEQCIQSGQWITHGPGIDCGLAWSLDNNFSSELEKWFTWHSLELTQLSRFCSYWATRECPKYKGQGRASYSHSLVTSYIKTASWQDRRWRGSLQLNWFKLCNLASSIHERLRPSLNWSFYLISLSCQSLS